MGRAGTPECAGKSHRAATTLRAGTHQAATLFCVISEQAADQLRSQGRLGNTAAEKHLTVSKVGSDPAFLSCTPFSAGRKHKSCTAVAPGLGRAAKRQSPHQFMLHVAPPPMQFRTAGSTLTTSSPLPDVVVLSHAEGLLVDVPLFTGGARSRGAEAGEPSSRRSGWAQQQGRGAGHIRHADACHH